MSMQPQFFDPGSQAPGPVAPYRVADPRPPNPSRHPRLPDPPISHLVRPPPPQSVPASPPSPRLPTRIPAQFRPPAPSRVFWKKLLHAHNTPASSSRTQQYSPIRHPGVFSRDPAATSKPGSPCHPVNPASPASPSRETRPAHRPSQRPSRRRRLANSPKKTASSYLWPAGPLWGTGWPEIAPPFSPRPPQERIGARPLHSHLEARRPAKDLLDGRRNHRPRG